MKQKSFYRPRIFNHRLALYCVLNVFVTGLCFAATAIATPKSVALATSAPIPLLPPVSAPVPSELWSSFFAARPLLTLPSGETVNWSDEVKQAAAPQLELQQPCGIPGVNDWCPVWISSPYDGPGHKSDSPGNAFSTNIMATSPDGKLVFVAGTSDQSLNANSTDYEVVTIAYDAASGNTVWITPYVAASGGESYAQSLAVGGSRVFVRMTTSGQSTSTLLAYDAATGAPLWPAPVQVPNGGQYTWPMTANSDGSRVYVTGGQVLNLGGGTYRIDAVTIAYDGATGAQLWTASIPGPAGTLPLSGYANGFGVAAVGNKVFMAAVQLDSQGYITEVDLLVADAANGQTITTGAHGNLHADDEAGFTVSADGSRAFMLIQDLPSDSSGNLEPVMAVAAFDARTGQSLWFADYFGPNHNSPTTLNSWSVPWLWGAIAASPDGSRVFAATQSNDGLGLAGSGFTTVAYDGATGAQLWFAEYNTDTPLSYLFTGPLLRIDPAGRAVYVVGMAAQATTFAAFAYDPVTGAALKSAVYANGITEANGMAISPDGSRIFVATENGSSANSSTHSVNYDIVTLAYDTGLVPLPNVTSRKIHGSAGTFDVELPLTGNPGTECRAGGTTGDYTLVFTFANNLTSVGGASVSRGTGSVANSHIDSNDAQSFIVNLTGVTNAQVVTVTLSNVSDSVGDFSASISASMRVLVGDVNTSGLVDSGDVFLVRQQTGQTVIQSNFREDVNASGLIDSGDVFMTRQQTGTSSP